MKLLREVNLYEKYGEKLVNSYVLKINFKTLSEILNLNKSDNPDRFKIYKLVEIQFQQIRHYLIDYIESDFSEFDIYY